NPRKVAIPANKMLVFPAFVRFYRSSIPAKWPFQRIKCLFCLLLFAFIASQAPQNGLIGEQNACFTCFCSLLSQHNPRKTAIPANKTLVLLAFVRFYRSSIPAKWPFRRTKCLFCLLLFAFIASQAPQNGHPSEQNACFSCFCSLLSQLNPRKVAISANKPLVFPAFVRFYHLASRKPGRMANKKDGKAN
ncbi:MAG: hypothetical protein IKX10_03825, partial [Lachnospiraceae bacterium]|nr:hypothetical protein [Lachnospiraceae bacterium]